MDVPCLIVQALRDEYQPQNVDQKKYVKRLKSAMPKAVSSAVNSLHYFTGHDNLVVLHITSFLMDNASLN